IVGYGYMKLMLRLGRYLTPHANPVLKRLQVLTSALVALSHGANDAQKGMGIITAGLVAGGTLDRFEVPALVIVSCAAAIALGVAGALLIAWLVTVPVSAVVAAALFLVGRGLNLG